MDIRPAALALLALLAGCDRAADTSDAPAPAPSPSAAATLAPGALPVRRAAAPMVGTWTSAPNALGGGRRLRLSVGVDGAYAAEATIGSSVDASSSGRLSPRGAGVASRADVAPADPALAALGAWTATVDGARLTLATADGRRVVLSREP